MDFVFTIGYPVMLDEPCSSSTDSSPNLPEGDAEWSVKGLRRKTDDLPDDGETESHPWTDEVESETLEESEVLLNTE